MKGLAAEKGPTFAVLRGKRSVLEEELATEKVRPWGALLVFVFLLSFIFPSPVNAGVIRKPPNNLGLTGYWSLDDGTVGTIGGIAGDFSGNRRNGLLTVTSTFGPPMWVTGKRGKAVTFDGVNDIILTNVVGNQFFSTATGTVSLWVKPRGTSPTAANANDAARIFGSVSSLSLSAGISRGVVGGLDRIWAYNYSGGNTQVGVSYPNDAWTHIVLVHASSTLYIYKDGVLGGSVASGLTTSLGTAISFGSSMTANFFNGTIDEVRTYSRALELADIAYLYQSGSIKIGLTNPSPGTLADGLTGYWTFDGKDISGTSATDRSGNGYTGTLTNGPVSAIGKIGQALAFDGTNDYVDSNADYTNFITDTDGTISAWIRPRGIAPSVTKGAIYNSRTAVSSLTTFSSIGITKANNTTFGGDMIWGYNSSIGCGLFDVAGVSYNTNEWTHITWVHSGGTLYLYKNGDLATSTPSGTTSAGCGTGNLVVGTTWTGAGNTFWNGDIDEVRTYNRALSASEIKQLSNIGAVKVSKTSTPTGTLQTGLKGWWTFDGADVSGTTVIDRSGNGNTGTLANGASPTIGKIGQGVNLVAANSQSVSLGASSTIQPTAGTSFSVSLWYKGLKGTTEFFISSGPSFGNYWDITNGSADFVTGGPFVSQGYSLPKDNDWHHLVIVLSRNGENNDSVTAYLDGVSQGSATYTLNSQDVSGVGGVNIGRGTWASGGYRQGPMDDVRIYNRVLSANEVKQLYNLGK